MNIPIDFNIYSMAYVLIGMVISAVIMSVPLCKTKKEIKMLKRQYEKKSQGMDDSGLRVKTLENKIKTLETALKKQMEKSE